MQRTAFIDQHERFAEVYIVVAVFSLGCSQLPIAFIKQALIKPSSQENPTQQNASDIQHVQPG
jgi:hypothetical protein